MCVLLVEDNEQVGAFAPQALKELGYDSVHAVDAERALDELAKDCSRFHIVFSDVVMPGMSGLELGQEIRRRYPDVPVVLTSGYSHVLAQNGKHGFELLHKPYSVETTVTRPAQGDGLGKAETEPALSVRLPPQTFRMARSGGDIPLPARHKRRWPDPPASRDQE